MILTFFFVSISFLQSLHMCSAVVCWVEGKSKYNNGMSALCKVFRMHWNCWRFSFLLSEIIGLFCVCVSAAFVLVCGVWWLSSSLRWNSLSCGWPVSTLGGAKSHITDQHSPWETISLSLSLSRNWRLHTLPQRTLKCVLATSIYIILGGWKLHAKFWVSTWVDAHSRGRCPYSKSLKARLHSHSF